MESCGECGNRAVAPQVDGGVAVFECGLCGALSGDAQAVRSVRLLRAARAQGLEPRVYAVASALAALPGVEVGKSRGVDLARQQLPAVSFCLPDARGLVQLENLGRSLLLASRELALPWSIEVEVEDVLWFVLRPRLSAAAPTLSELSAAAADLALLQRAFERDPRLRWWRHPPGR